MKKQILYYILLCFVIASIIHLINSARMGWDKNFLLNYVQYSINFVYALLIGLANIIFFGVLYKFYSWETAAKKLVFLGVIGSVVVTTLAFYLARVVHFTIILDFSYAKFLAVESIANYIFSMTLAFIITMIYHLVYFFAALKEAQKRELELLNVQQSNEISSLKQQLDPHFLFNNLQVLTALIEENKEKALEFTNELAQVYRYVIQQKEHHLVHLEEEVNFAKNYLNLMTKRFEEGIDFQLSLNSEDKKYMLVPLSLQLLLENIFKHNTISSASPLRINIQLENNYLVVQNEGKRKTNSSNSTQVGLTNINQQYLRLIGKEISIEESSTTFVVKIPLIELEK